MPKPAPSLKPTSSNPLLKPTGMGGGEVYERLKEIDPTVKVLLSSGYSINGQVAEILKRGCDGFIQKPFKLNELSFKLREIISK